MLNSNRLRFKNVINKYCAKSRVKVKYKKFRFKVGSSSAYIFLNY
jgi:hypothetical protein